MEKCKVQQNHKTVGVGGFEARVDKNGMLRKGFKGVLEMPAEEVSVLKKQQN